MIVIVVVVFSIIVFVDSCLKSYFGLYLTILNRNGENLSDEPCINRDLFCSSTSLPELRPHQNRDKNLNKLNPPPPPQKTTTRKNEANFDAVTQIMTSHPAKWHRHSAPHAHNANARKGPRRRRELILKSHVHECRHRATN